MIDKHSKVLYWLTRDLRIHDNEVLHAVSAAKYLKCVYVIDLEWFKHRPWQRPGLSAIRWQFLMESLQVFRQSLIPFGHTLTVLYGSASQLLPEIIKSSDFNHLVLSRHSGSDVQGTLKNIIETCPGLKATQFEQYTLFRQNELPFKLVDLAKTFSGFRKLLETHPCPEPLPPPLSLPHMPKIKKLTAERAPDFNMSEIHSLRFTGGEREAHRHLREYFSSDAAHRYKSQRNELSGWQNSSKFSPWLSNGCLSPKTVRHALTEYELRAGQSKSSQWLYVELLWREYFQWWHFAHGDALFSFQGTKKTPLLTSFYPERFKKWCEGETPYKLVNACMKELKQTGYLSNRGRQIVASCLVNELSIDWRYGAAWFEHCLIDYDTASNWGNWQYISGVGVDARGGRHFNLKKQEMLYDPDGLYQKRWRAEVYPNLDTRDAADWPITT